MQNTNTDFFPYESPVKFENPSISFTNTACGIREDFLDVSKWMNEQNPWTKMDLFERNWAAQKIEGRGEESGLEKAE